MADISDVLHGLRDALASVLDAAGMVQPSSTWKGTRLYVGWPGADLDRDLAAGVAHITIWPRAGMARVMNPYMDGWHEAPRTPSLVASVAEDAVTFSGTGAVPMQIAALIVDGAASYTYPLAEGDGPAQVAAALAALVAADRPAEASGTVLTIPGSFRLVSRIVAGGSEHREVRRLAQSIQISAWTSSPAIRDALIRAIDDALIDEHRTLPMPDGTLATITYEGTAFDEDARQQPLHRRDLFISVEYASARVRTAPAIAVPDVDYQSAPGVIRRTILS